MSFEDNELSDSFEMRKNEDAELASLRLRLCIAARSGECGYSRGLHISNPSGGLL